MDTTPQSAIPPEDDALVLLAELTALGMQVSRALAAQAVRLAASDPIPGTPDAGLAFTRAARAVRQTLALAKKFRAETTARPTGRMAAMEAERRVTTARIRQKIKLEVAEAIAREAEPHEHEDLLQDLDELLDSDDIAFRVGRQPIKDIVARISARLALTAKCAEWPDETLNQLEIRVDENDDPIKPSDDPSTHPYPASLHDPHYPDG